MAIPFPPVTNFTPYPTVAFLDPALNTSSKAAWLATPAPANAEWFDMTALRKRVATGISVSGKTLTLTAAGASKSFDLSGDGTGRIPVGIIDP